MVEGQHRRRAEDDDVDEDIMYDAGDDEFHDPLAPGNANNQAMRDALDDVEVQPQHQPQPAQVINL